MPILNIFFTKISAEREQRIGNVKVSARLNLKDPEESELKIENKKVLVFPFEFELDYEKNAKIILAGYLNYAEEKKRAEEILKGWKKEKELSKLIFNFILTKCNLKALLIEDQLGLPYHLPMPKLK
ncbi:MAG: hypothetical protein QW199_01305 [Candidatus Pacearchaeota archaeon]